MFASGRVQRIAANTGRLTPRGFARYTSTSSTLFSGADFMVPWCSGLAYVPVKDEIAGSNPVGTATFGPSL